MKEKLKLRGWVKVVITLLVLGVSIFIYQEVGILGQQVNKSTLADILVIGGWFWLIVGQTLLIKSTWED